MSGVKFFNNVSIDGSQTVTGVVSSVSAVFSQIQLVGSGGETTILKQGGSDFTSVSAGEITTGVVSITGAGSLSALSGSIVTEFGDLQTVAGRILSGTQDLTEIFAVGSPGDFGVKELSALTDVDLTTPAEGEILIYNSTAEAWQNKPNAGAALSAGGFAVVSNKPRINGDLTINGTLCALSGATFVNTTFTTTSSLCVYAELNTGSALWIGANGTGDIASFYDTDQNVEVLHVGGANGTHPNVGVKTSEPNKDLTISGEVSASGDVWFGANIHANNQHLSSLYAAKGATDAATSVVNSGSARWDTAYRQLSSGNLSAAGAGFTVNVSLSTPSLSAGAGVVAGALSAGNFYGDGSGLTNINAGNIQGFSGVTSVNGLTGAVTNVVFTTSANNFTQSLTGTTGLFTTSLSAPALSGVHFGDGSQLTGIASGVTSVNGLTGAVANVAFTTSSNNFTQSLTGTTAVFTTSVSSVAVSGTHYGDGSMLTMPAYVLTNSGATLTADGIKTPYLSAQTLTGDVALFNTSVSSAKLSGAFYGDGSGLTNINAGNIAGLDGVTSVNGLTGAITNVAFTVSANSFSNVNTFSQTTNFQAITATSGTFSGNILSAGQNLNTLFGNKAVVDSVASTVQSITASGLSTVNLTATNGIFDTLSAGSLSAASYLSGGQNLTAIFGSKSSTDSVVATVANTSANWDAGYNTSRALSTGPTFDGSKGYKFVSNNPAIYGDLTIYGTLNALSGSTFYNTTFTTTSSLCVVNAMNVSQAALYIGASGSGDIASFYDIDANVEVLHVGGATGSFPNVGVRTSAPNKTLTVSGDVSATGEMYASKYFLGAIDISSTYSTVTANSANWNTAYTSVTSNSANWNTSFRQLSSGALSAAGVGFTVGVSLSTPALTAGTGVFSTSLSAPAVSGSHFGSGVNLTALNASNISSGTLGNSFLPAAATFSTSVSAPAVSGTFFGSGANLTNLPAATLPAVGTFTTSVSSPAVSGTHFGSGANLTSLNASNISSGTLGASYLPAVGTFTTSVSSPSISAVNMFGNLVAPVTTQTATFTLGLANAGGVIRIAPTSDTQVYVNVPASGTANFPIGTQTIIAQVSAATVTVSAAAGVTLLSYQSKTSLAAQNSVASLIKTGTDEWLLAGDIN